MMVSPHEAVMQMSASRYHPASATAGHQYHHAVPPAAIATPMVGNFHHHSSRMAAAPTTSLWSNNISNNSNGPAGYPPPPQQQQQQLSYQSTNAFPISLQQQKHQHQEQPLSVAMLPSQNATYQLSPSDTPNEGDDNVSNEILPQGTARVEKKEHVQTEVSPLFPNIGIAFTEPTQTDEGVGAGYHPPPMAHGGNLTIMDQPLPLHQPLHASVMLGPAPVTMSINPQLNNNCIPTPNTVTVYGSNHPLSHYANDVGATAVLQHAPYLYHGATSVAHASHYDPHHPNGSTAYYQPQSGLGPPSMGTSLMHHPIHQHRPLAIDPNMNNQSNANNVGHGNMGTAFLQHRMPQHQQFQHTVNGAGNNQPMLIQPEKRSAATTTPTAGSQGGGGNLAHCA